MRRYSVAGRGAAPSAGGDPYAVLWNPSTTKTIFVVALEIADPAAGSATPAIQRTSTRGTPGSTITPDIDNDYDRALAPESGAVLDLADFTVIPTFEGPRLSRWSLTFSGGSLELVINDPIAVPQNTGLMIEVVAGLQVIETSWVWEE